MGSLNVPPPPPAEGKKNERHTIVLFFWVPKISLENLHSIVEKAKISLIYMFFLYIRMT